MDRFNKVFVVIKKCCSQQKLFAEVCCFDTIAKEAEVSVARLSTYLNYLQDIGLIKYSLEEKYIYLTRLGMACEDAAPAKTPQRPTPA